MMARQKEQSPEEFWRDYENSLGEKVLARGLGRYLSGWDEFDAAGETPLWGLLIVTGRGFRFHHFPQINWFDALVRPHSGGVTPKEKTFFIPHEWIDAAELRLEKSPWRRLFAPRPPLLAIRYRNGEARELLAETDTRARALAELLGEGSLKNPATVPGASL
jgi:hypothetical protein